MEYDSEHWESQFFNELITTDSADIDKLHGDVEADPDEEQPVIPRYKLFAEVIRSLEDVQAYLDYRGCADVAKFQLQAFPVIPHKLHYLTFFQP